MTWPAFQRAAVEILPVLARWRHDTSTVVFLDELGLTHRTVSLQLTFALHAGVMTRPTRAVLSEKRKLVAGRRALAATELHCSIDTLEAV